LVIYFSFCTSAKKAFFAWSLTMGGLILGHKLQYLGVAQPKCLICANDTIKHLLWFCVFVKLDWQWVYKICSQPLPPQPSIGKLSCLGHKIVWAIEFNATCQLTGLEFSLSGKKEMDVFQKQTT